ncbi:metalloregulator ArsR/SmtB family transcription factor [Polaromonas sp. YR568]|uniref:ArsR/SmtB family transcription factor n=1 Tax=Polaromonas sp. YR568 TaxID=1855301 RepID=UPI0031380E76
METVTAPPSPLTLLSPLDESAAVKALAALAQAQRLRAFRALVVAGPTGLTPGAMSAQLGVAPSALSFHLKELTHAGLISSEARGRNLIYRASFGHMNALLGYLTEHCCEGQVCSTTADAACVAC